MRRRAFVILGVSILLVCSVEAGGFSKLPLGARAVTLGGSLVAFGDDPNVLFYNPAGLASLKSFSASTSFTLLMTGITDDQLKYFSGSAGANLGILGAFGIGGKVFTSNVWKENELFASYGRTLLFDWIAVGGTVKLLHWSIPAPAGRLAVPEPSLSKVTLSFDMGGQIILSDFIPNNDLRFGGSIADVTRPSIARNGAKEGRLDRRYTAGVAYVSRVYDYAVTVHYTVQGRVKRLGIGTEFVALKTAMLGEPVQFIVRAGGGIAPEQQGDVNGGFGLLVGGVMLDYAFTHQTELLFMDGSHHLSLRYEF